MRIRCVDFNSNNYKQIYINMVHQELGEVWSLEQHDVDISTVEL